MGSTQMKLAVHVLAPLIAGFPAPSVTSLEYAVVSPRKSGAWNVPCTSRTPVPGSSLVEVTVNGGARSVGDAPVAAGAWCASSHW